MGKIVITDPLQPAGLDVLERRPDVLLELAVGTRSDDELARRVAGADAILVGLTRITPRSSIRRLT